MEQKTKKIIAMRVIDKRLTQGISQRMESEGFKQALDEIQRSGIKVTEVVTDAHPSVSAIMSKSSNILSVSPI